MQLEVSHRRCVKQILNVGRNTNTDVALSCLNIESAEELIDFEKLEFFGQLCRLPVRFLAKKVFIHRLVRYCLGCVNMQGLIPDIYRLLQKYSLMPTLETYLERGVFPGKMSWKRTIKQSVRMANRQRRSHNANEITCLEDSKLFKADRTLTAIVICKTSPSLSVIIHKSTKILSMAMSRQFASKCAICNKFTYSIVNHTLWFCDKTESKRNNLIVELYTVTGHCKFMQIMILPVMAMSRHLVCLALTVNEDDIFRNFVLLKLICDLF
ncbi:hypothetical protein DPMN_131705 [Dreissena polymorpha]|uniref:Uncharacterized protein n=1 Tax=Dreissena polymorpha TaxID=45954 RepID=A0A9D4FTN2_DREPO|nr:hypothetical protein DPMN_131705 [Dreissena polymorpha]